jgi:lysophospholipase L1-like esterase
LNERRKVLIGPGIALAVLLGLEGAARVVTTIESDMDAPLPGDLPESGRWLLPSTRFGWELRPNFTGHVWDLGRHPRRFDAHGHLALDSEQIADETRPKVVFIGDSNTFGWGNPSEKTFVEVVDRMLPEVDAINLAVPGYSSYQGKLVLEQALGTLRPSLVVVSFNFNDRRYVLGVPDGAERFAAVDSGRASAPVLRRLERLHVFQALRRIARWAGALPAADVESAPVETLIPRVNEQDYRRNLSEMVGMAQRAEVPILLLLLNDSPLESYHLREGLRVLDTDASTAVRHLTLASRVSPSFLADLARLHLAEAHRALGNPARAASAALVPSIVHELDGGGAIRLDTTYNDIMREVAAAHGVPLIDGGSAVDADPGDYVDMCHFNAEGHQRVAEALAPAIRALLARSDAAGR